ncbi:hypothetical protein HF521_017001 [Silurus meridionalis]|uniref:Little elongation complex subunit 1 C-terminal domain-containing protein n=1 Tax=Silurus meridionalis TaxID=175797 RepID=A0A8T0BLL5_SILME|nr:hypothetical protein HF521_017001 [Silurus meridionalis]
MVMISVLLPGTTYSAWTFSVHNWAGFGPSPMLYDLPWELQLAVVYAIHDLAPSSPKVALNALESWKKDLTKPFLQPSPSA